MKNKKNVLWSVLVGAVLCLVLTGCTPEPAEVPELVDLPTVSILTIGETDPVALERVSAALSEITAQRIGCRVELRMIREDEYDERIDDLLLESNFADIFVCRDRTTMNKLMAGSYIYRLDRYLARRPQLRNAIEDPRAWNQVKSQGYTYAIPFGYSEASAWGFVMRKDICDELGVDGASITTLDQLHEVLLTVQKAYPDLIPAVSDYGEAQTFADIDLMKEGAGCLIANGQVVDVCSMPEFVQRCARMQQWYEEGLILRNTQLNQAGRDGWMKDGLAFGSFTQLDRYTCRDLEYMLDEPVECVVLDDSYYASGMMEESFAVYAYTEDVDLCLQVLQLIYTDESVLRLCIYGEEAVDYTLSPEGFVLPGEGGTYVNWCWPGRDIVPPPYSKQDPAWYNESDGNTFMFDNRAVANEIYQCGEVLEKYYEALCSGAIDSEEGIQRMNEELNGANQAKVREELERQWAAWHTDN